MNNSPTKFPLPLETMLAKTFQFCPSMLTNPLNLSPTAISRGAELLSRYQNQCQSMEHKPIMDTGTFDENGNTKNFLNIESKGRKSRMSDARKIDRIAENLRSTTKDRSSSIDSHDPLKTLPLMAQNMPLPLPLDMKNVPNFGVMPTRFGSAMPLGNGDDIKMANLAAAAAAGTSAMSEMITQNDNALPLKTTLPPTSAASCSINQKQANSKLYATCFICHKQLSNQYNLRVHLETHQNVR